MVILEIRYHRARTALVWPNSAQAFKRAAASEYAWRASTQAPRTQRDQAAYSYLATHANPPHTIQEHLTRRVPRAAAAAWIEREGRIPGQRRGTLIKVCRRRTKRY